VIGIAETRLSCGIAGTPDQLVQFNQHYTANLNPAFDSLTAGGMSLSTDDQGTTNSVRAGDSLALDAAWASCPQPTGAAAITIAISTRRRELSCRLRHFERLHWAETYVSWT